MKLRISTLDEGLADEETLRRVDEGTGGWCTPELLRVKGMRLLASVRDDAQERAAALFLRAIEVAREQQALSWELRNAVSLARLRRLQGRVGEAHALLGEVLGRFSEGFETADVVEAQNLLEALRAAQDQAA
jgi:predicted ATPase